jgi:hypothetical protein
MYYPTKHQWPAHIPQCEVLYHKIELLVAMDHLPAYNGQSRKVCRDTRDMVEAQKLPSTFSRKFGMLCYNLSVQRLKQTEQEPEEQAQHAEAALFWSEQAALFFCRGPTCNTEHAQAKSLSAKARIMVGLLDDALQDLRVANSLAPSARSQLLELQCLGLMKR